MKNILILGGSGRIGQQFINLLKLRGANKVFATYFKNKSRLPYNPDTWFKWDGFDDAGLAEIFSKDRIDGIINCIGPADSSQWEKNGTVGFNLIQGVANSLLALPITFSDFIMVDISSSEVTSFQNGKLAFDESRQLYCKCKLEAESIYRNKFKNCLIVRPHNVFSTYTDSGGGIVNKLRKSLLSGEPFFVKGNLSSKRYYISSFDLSNFCLSAVDIGLFHTTEICNPRLNYSVQSVLHEMVQYCDKLDLQSPRFISDNKSTEEDCDRTFCPSAATLEYINSGQFRYQHNSLFFN